jgi:hypothetical protein
MICQVLKLECPDEGRATWVYQTWQPFQAVTDNSLDTFRDV